MEFNAEILAARLLGHKASGARAEEWVKNIIAGFRSGQDTWLYEFGREGGEMRTREKPWVLMFQTVRQFLPFSSRIARRS